MHVVYLENYHGSSAIVFSGGRKSMQILRDIFVEFDKRKTKVDLISEFNKFEPCALLKVSGVHLGQRDPSKVQWEDGLLTWFLSDASLDKIVGLLDGLLEQDEPGHQYIETDFSPVQIVCSKDEQAF